MFLILRRPLLNTYILYNSERILIVTLVHKKENVVCRPLWRHCVRWEISSAVHGEGLFRLD